MRFEHLLRKTARYDWAKDPVLIRKYMADFRAQGERVDANETALFLRSLTEISTKTWDTMFPELKARLLIPVSHEVPTGAEYHALQAFDPTGQAAVIDDYSKDFPAVQIRAGEKIIGIKSLGASYKYSIQDIRNADFARRPLDAKRAMFARESIERKLEDVAASGVVLGTTKVLSGLVNNGDVAITTVTNGSWNSLVYSADGVNSGKILADMHQMANYPFTHTSTIFGNPDTMLLPTGAFAQINSQRMSQYDSKTILQAFLDSSTIIKSVDWWLPLNTASATSGERAMVYRRDPNYVALQIPQEFEQFPPQVQGMEWTVPCHMRTAGVEVYRPGVMAYFDNVHS